VIASLDPRTAIALVAKLAAMGTVVSCAEYLAAPRHLRSDGLMSWNVSSLRRRWLVAGPAAPLFEAMFSYPSVLAFLALRAAVAAVILVGPLSFAVDPVIVGLAAVLGGLFVVRNSYGLDGADQMGWILFIGLALATLVGTPAAWRAFLWFLALESCLSYAVAGIAKASAPGWRDGTYLVAICGTRIYGNPGLTHFLKRHDVLARLLARLVIAWECSFVLVLLVPLPVALAMLGGGAVFHLVNAYFMGLNTFFWSFISTYPAILYCVQTRGW
jgi:hypothetical protein